MIWPDCLKLPPTLGGLRARLMLACETSFHCSEDLQLRFAYAKQVELFGLALSTVQRSENNVRTMSSLQIVQTVLMVC